MTVKTTHKEFKTPKISSRYLADYMAASDRKRRSILRSCKYPPIARVLQHTEAKASISNFVKAGNPDTSSLSAKADSLRNRLSDGDFDRQLLDVNADYIDRFVLKYGSMDFPKADAVQVDKWPRINISGVSVSPDALFQFQRTTKTNKVNIGIGAIRYSKGSNLAEDVGLWQSAFLFGYLTSLELNGEIPEKKLCMTLDAYAGVVYPAPGDSVRRFANMEAACASIADMWDKIEAPE
jgi:hypothetical protein